MFRTPILIFLCLNAILASAQFHNNRENVWAFGYNSGLDFNNGNPQPIQTKIETGEGAASICDDNGQLLFYTDGSYVFNRNHDIMLNGQNLTGEPSRVIANSSYAPTYSSSQGSLIVPIPKDKHKYYVFSISSVLSNKPSRLYYSIVDMTLNDGLGDIVPGQKGILLDSLVTEKMTAAASSHCSIWLITSAVLTHEFKCYEISDIGLNKKPVTSTIGPGYTISSIIGSFAVSNNGKRLASTAFSSTTVNSSTGSYFEKGGIAIFDFDIATGIISNPLLIDERANVYGVIFSPDNTKLYFQGIQNAFPHLYQYDVSSNNAATILSSRVAILYPGMYPGVSGVHVFSTFKLAPDNKIYMNGRIMDVDNLIDSAYIGVIEYPNLPGTSCKFVKDAIQLLPGTYSGLSLPNIVPILRIDSQFNYWDTTMCLGRYIDLSGVSGYENYLWNDGDTGRQKIITQPGKYWVASKNISMCRYQVDTYMVWGAENFEVDLGQDTLLCYVQGYALEVNVPRATYLWQDHSSNNTLEVDKQGLYWVRVSRDGCVLSDSIVIQMAQIEQDLGADSSVCKGIPLSPIHLKANLSFPGSYALWSTGSTDTAIVISDTGTYWVEVRTKSGECIANDTLHIIPQLCNCYTFLPNVFSPNSDGINDIFLPLIESGCRISNYAFSVFNRFGERVFYSGDPTMGWNGSYKTKPADVGTYFYELHYWGSIRDIPYFFKGDLLLIR